MPDPQHIPQQAPARPTNIKRSKLQNIDLQQLEELYAAGGNHMHAARAIGISDTYWSEYRGGAFEVEGLDLSEVLSAIKRGQHRIAAEVLTDLRNHSKKNMVASIFLSKQEHILDFKDQRQVENSGEIKLTVSHRLMEPAPTHGQIEHNEQGVIDITPGEDS